jgi:hypothetical protein
MGPFIPEISAPGASSRPLLDRPTAAPLAHPIVGLCDRVDYRRHHGGDATSPMYRPHLLLAFSLTFRLGHGEQRLRYPYAKSFYE